MEPLTKNESTETATPAPIVVGVDGTERSRAALEWAVEQATLRGTTLRVVHAVDAVENYMTGRRIVERATAAARELAPQLTVGCTTPMRSPRVALLDEAKHAQLLVLARPARSGQSRIVAHIVTHAPCTVVLVAVPKESDLRGGG